MSMQRYLIVSDVLFSERSRLEDERWFPPQVAAIHKIEKLTNRGIDLLGMPAYEHVDWSQEILTSFDRSTQKNYRRMLEEARKRGPYAAIIGAGNYTIGVRERGMIVPKCVDLFHKFDHWMTAAFEELRKVYAPGGHDIGYRYRVKDRTKVLKIGNESGGLSKESIAAFQRHVGPLYGLEDLGAIRVLFISSGIIRNVNHESPPELKTIKIDQYSFLQAALECLDDAKPTFLVMHDPTALSLCPFTVDLLWMYREKISAIIHGHSRARFVATLTKANTFYRKLCRNFTVICNPAPAGMFGIGKGFTILYVTDGGMWYPEHVSLRK